MFNFRSILTALALAAVLSPTAQAATASKAFTVTNTGNGPLTVSGAVISGNTAEYALTGNTCASVASGSSCALTVTFAPTATGVRPAASLSFNSSGTNGPTHNISLSGIGAPSEIARLISANASDVNMAALFGNPVAAGTYVLTINSGVRVTASSTATAALTTGTFPAGSTVKIVNNGYIIGAGGAGGSSPTTIATGGAGGAGGPALWLSTSVSLDNTNGAIYGGGGGGGSGGNGSAGIMGIRRGGGGGGGAGEPGGAGGAGGNLGTIGSTVGGAGGATLYMFAEGSLPWGGAGGAGGNYGQPGASGAQGNSTLAWSYGGTGGAAGSAILKNGNTITWLGGNNTSQVKGAVQ